MVGVVSAGDNVQIISVGTLPNTVSVVNSPNQVVFNDARFLVSPQVIENQVTLVDETTVVAVNTMDVAVSLVQSPVIVAVPASAVKVLSIAQQGPAGADGVSGEAVLLTKAERKDTVTDSPGVGDITVYHGTGAIGTGNATALWLISRRIFLKDGTAFDSEKLFASAVEDQVWDDHLSLTYA